MCQFFQLAYFHGLEPGEEISITIEEGKNSLYQTSPCGRSTENSIHYFRIKWKARTTLIQDKSVKGDAKSREKAVVNDKYVGL